MAEQKPVDFMSPSSGIIPFKRPRSRIANDPEIMTFIIARAATTTQTEILTQCRQRFGYERGPSRAGLNRFLKALSKAASGGK